MEIRISVPKDGKGDVEIHLVEVDEKQNIKFVEEKYSRPSKKPKPIVKQEPRWIEDKTVCACCGKWLFNPATGRKKRFCNDDCRRKWWNLNRDQMNKGSESQYVITCVGCGKQFISYGNSKRKYCSKECYVNHRYWDGNEPTREDESILNVRAPIITMISDIYPEK